MLSTQSAGHSITLAKPIVVSKKAKKFSTTSRLKKRSKRKMELRSRWRKIQNAGPDLKTTAEITTANSITPLLRLPQELKDRIYELVLGSSNMLHIKRDLLKFKRETVHSTKGDIKERRFTHQICCSQISEKDAQHHFDAEDGNSLYMKDVELRHMGCGPSRRKGSTFAPHRIDVNLLHVCRQTYNEARLIPYSTNTFSFDTARNLRAFVNLLVQRGVNVNAFRSLRVDLAHINHDLHGWAQAFNAVAQHMKLLETLYINVDQRPKWSTSADAERKKMAMKPVLDCLTILGKMQAKSTMIMVSDRFLSGKLEFYPAIAPAFWNTHRWTMKEKRLWVEEVKFAIQNMQLFG